MSSREKKPLTFREPTAHELAALQSLTKTNHVGTMPVKFNGEDRYAIVIMHQGSQGPFVQIVGILPSENDELVDSAGNKSVTTIPGTTEKLN